MGIIGGKLGYGLPRVLWQGQIDNLAETAYARDKVKVVLGPNVYEELRGKVVVDFGCGEGLEPIRIAQNGSCSLRQTRNSNHSMMPG
jgi:hypothetical protein